jgi:DNA polymerase-3 subunit gamma/tau
MVVRCAGPEARDLSVPPRHREALTRQAGSLALDTILAGLDILAATKARLRGSDHGRVLVEMALIRLARLEDLASVVQLAEMLAGGGRPPPGPPPPSRGQMQAVAPGPRLAQLAADRSVPPPPPPQASTALTAESLPRIWADALSQTPPMMRSDLEKAGSLAISGPNTLVLRFGNEYNAQREHCQDPKRVEKVEGILRSLTGQAVTLRIESGGGDRPGRPAAAPEDADNSQSRSRRQREEALREPLVKRAIEVLGAQIVRVDEGFGAMPAPSADRTEPAESQEK